MKTKDFILASFLLLGTVFLGCASSAPYASQGKRQPNVQKLETVAIRVHCPTMEEGSFFFGTGVVISATQVLTAAHVVPCLDGQIRAIQLTDPPAGFVEMEVEVTSLDLDMARLKISGETHFDERFVAKPIVVGRVFPKDKVCFTPAIPEVDHVCGTVEEIEENGNIVSDANAVPGNSGSGLYNEAGRLVGIVTMRRSADGSVKGSIARPLKGHEWLLK